MKNKGIIFFIVIIMTKLLLPAALIPEKVKSQTSYYTNKATEKVLGPILASKLKNHSTTFLDWWNLYLKRITPTTPAEFRMHGLWYGFKSGTSRSLYGEDPTQSLHKYYLKNKDYFTKKDQNEEAKSPKKNKLKELNKNPKHSTISKKTVEHKSNKKIDTSKKASIKKDKSLSFSTYQRLHEDNKKALEKQKLFYQKAEEKTKIKHPFLQRVD